jgi:lipopolysaccharide exporter
MSIASSASRGVLQSKGGGGGMTMDRRQYLKHVVIILSGNSAAQVVNLLSYPLLARLYSPQAFGGFATFVAASAIPATIACGRFDLAVPIAPRAGRFGILWLCAIIAAIAGLLSTVGATIYWYVAAQRVGAALPLLLGLTVALTGICAALSMFMMRHDRYRTQSVSVVTRTGGAVLVQVALGLFAATSFSLIVGFVFGLLAQALLLTIETWRHLEPRAPRMREIRTMFFRFRRQVMLDIPSALLAGFYLNILTLFLGVISDQRTVGFYAIGNRLAAVPLQLINDALSQTFFQKAARAREAKGHFWEEMKFGFLTSGALSIAVLIGIVLLARPFIVIYMGARWAPAAGMLIILAPMLAAMSVGQSVATAVFVLRKTHWRLMHTAALFLLHLVIFWVARSLHLSVYEYLTIVSATFVVAWTGYAILLLVASRRRFAALSTAVEVQQASATATNPVV